MRSGSLASLAAAFVTALVGVVRPASAQSAENVAVVINENSPASQRVGYYYATRRALPAANIIRIRTSADETIDRPQFVTTIQVPLASALAARHLQDRVLYIVLTKGVPIRVVNRDAPVDTVASVDSELTLLYRAMTGVQVPVAGTVPNPYFLGNRAIAEAKPFTHREHDIYLLTRLDAFTEDEAIALVNRAAAPRARVGSYWISRTN